MVKKLVNYADNIPFRCYVDENNEHIKPKDIPEYYLIQTGAIQENVTVNIPLNRYESPLKVESIFVSVSSERNEKLNIEVVNNSTEIPQTVFIDYLDRSELPYQFPPIILFPFNSIKIRPGEDIFNCLILLRPAIVLDHYNLQEDNQ